ncbi:hypothetical protein [Rubritalea sp.]|uniref:hypothetical protein n=1 Tax=Rubritalea sp. TaxID=2109375 RepID=UPI003EF24E0F
MNEQRPTELTNYPAHSLDTAEAALLEMWQGLENYHRELVLVGGLAVHYHTKDKAEPLYRGTCTLDIDLGISLATDGGMTGSVDWNLGMLGYRPDEERRMVKRGRHGNLYIDFLTEHPPNQPGTRLVSDVTATVCPGINRALACRKIIEITGLNRHGEEQVFHIPLCGIGPLLVLKLNAFGQRNERDRMKDAYDILVAVSSYSEGARAAIDAFKAEAREDNSGYACALQVLREHFSDETMAGPVAVSHFYFGEGGGNEEERDLLRQDLVSIALSLLGD